VAIRLGYAALGAWRTTLRLAALGAVVSYASDAAVFGLMVPMGWVLTAFFR
jgi:hypothetical protein